LRYSGGGGQTPEHRARTSLSDIWQVVDGRNRSGHRPLSLTVAPRALSSHRAARDRAVADDEDFEIGAFRRVALDDAVDILLHRAGIGVNVDCDEVRQKRITNTHSTRRSIQRKLCRRYVGKIHRLERCSYHIKLQDERAPVTCQRGARWVGVSPPYPTTYKADNNLCNDNHTSIHPHTCSILAYAKASGKKSALADACIGRFSSYR
jgi:hypothetical protein